RHSRMISAKHETQRGISPPMSELGRPHRSHVIDPFHLSGKSFLELLKQSPAVVIQVDVHPGIERAIDDPAIPDRASGASPSVTIRRAPSSQMAIETFIASSLDFEASRVVSVLSVGGKHVPIPF